MTPNIAGGSRQVLPHHLALVPSDAPAPAPAPAVADDDARSLGEDAAGPKHRKPDPVSTSTTMRALMALGAIAAALGLNCQQALGVAVHGKTRPHATRRGTEATPEGSLTLNGTGRGPVIGTAVTVVRSAGPAPGRTVIPVAYTLPEGAGRHRRPAEHCGESCGHTSGYVGKHRRHDSRPRHERDRGTRTTTGPKQAAPQTGPGAGHRRGGGLRRSV